MPGTPGPRRPIHPWPSDGGPARLPCRPGLTVHPAKLPASSPPGPAAAAGRTLAQGSQVRCTGEASVGGGLNECLRPGSHRRGQAPLGGWNWAGPQEGEGVLLGARKVDSVPRLSGCVALPSGTGCHLRAHLLSSTERSLRAVGRKAFNFPSNLGLWAQEFIPRALAVGRPYETGCQQLCTSALGGHVPHDGREGSWPHLPSGQQLSDGAPCGAVVRALGWQSTHATHACVSLCATVYASDGWS